MQILRRHGFEIYRLRGCHGSQATRETMQRGFPASPLNYVLIAEGHSSTVRGLRVVQAVS
jgi:hypothetical protein